MVRAPGLLRLTLTTDPTAHKMLLVGVAIRIPAIGVKNPRTIRIIDQIGVTALKSKIQFVDFGETRHVDAGIRRGTVPVGDGAELVFGKSFGVEGQPVSQPRETVREVKTTAAISGIGSATRLTVTVP